MNKILFLLLLVFSAKAQDFSKFKATSLKAVGSFQYNNASFYGYARYTENYEDSVITKPLIGKNIEAFVSQANKLILEANKDSVVNQLMLHSFISLSNYTTQWEAVKYRIVTKNDTTAFKVLVLKSENQKVQEDSETITSQILKNILRLKSEVYSQFEYETPTSSYTDLTSIAKQVKNTDGTLNLAKLGAFLATKPKELEKYCDY
jgi:hypothetical protein